MTVPAPAPAGSKASANIVALTNSSTSFEFNRLNVFIQDLKTIKTNISQTSTINKLLKSNPQYSLLRPLFGQISVFIDNFINGLEDIRQINKNYIELALRSKDQLIKQCEDSRKNRVEDYRHSVSYEQQERTISELRTILRDVRRGGITRDRGREIDTILGRGGAKQHNVFLKNFKNVLIRMDKILDNTKLSVEDKDKKLKKEMNKFKKNLESQVKKIKKSINKSSKKRNKIIKKSINKVIKISKKKNKKKKIKKKK